MIWQAAAIGDVSVMPHAWKIGMPILERNPSLSAGGTALPPHGMARSDDTSRPSISASTAIQIVGTPAATVTRSVSIRVSRAPGERSGPGITSVAPDATPACASPHALAWNMGTTGKMMSRSDAPRESAIMAPKVCRVIDRCVYTTPLGFPVVPEVYIIDAARFSSPMWNSRGSAPASSVS